MTLGQLVSPAFVGVPQPGPQGPPGPGGGGGGSATTTASFNQPLVWTVAVQTTLSIQISSSSGMQAGQGLTIVPGGGAYLISAVPDATHVTILNTGAAGNVLPGTNVASGAFLVVTGSGNPVALAASTSGQKLINIDGTLTPMIGEVPVFCTGLRSLHPNATNRHMLPVDGYATSADGGEGIFNYRVGANLYDDGGTTFVDATAALTGTFSATYGSTAVTASLSQTGLIAAGDVLTFGTGLNVAGVTQRYDIAAVAGTAITLQNQFGGTTSGGLTATKPTGGWVRSGVTSFLRPPWFGAFGDGSNDQAVIQSMMDLSKVGGARYFDLEVAGTRFKTKVAGSIVAPATIYRIGSQPLVNNDIYDPCGNICQYVYSNENAGFSVLTQAYDITASQPNDFFGPLFVSGYASDASHVRPTFSTSSYGGHSYSTVELGSTLGHGLNFLNLSTYDFSDLTVFNILGLEFFLQPDAAPSIDSVIAVHNGTAGTSFGTTQTFALECNSTSVFYTQRTTGGTVTVSSAAAGIALDSTRTNYIEIAYDGTTVYLYIGKDGVDLGGGVGKAVCLTGMHALASGAFLQDWWSEFRIGSNSGNWGYSYGDVGFASLEAKYGPMRVSVINRRTGTTAFTPDPSKLFYAASPNPVDSNTALVLDPAPANRPLRPSLQLYLLGKTGLYARNSPVWMSTNCSADVPFVGGSRFAGLVFSNYYGQGLQLFTCLYTQLTGCHFVACGQALNVDRYSYGFYIDRTSFELGGGVRNNFNSWSMRFDNGSQFVTVGPGMVGEHNNTLWYLLHLYSSMTIESCFLGGNRVGQIYAANGVDTLNVNNLTIDDEDGVSTGAGIYFEGKRLNINGGWINKFSGPATPAVLIGSFKAQPFGFAQVDIGCTIYSGLGIGFSSTALAQGYPVLFSGGSWGNTMIDPSAPGLVIHQLAEQAGFGAVAMLNATTTIGQDTMIYHVINVDGTAMTANRALKWPFTNIPGWRRTFRVTGAPVFGAVIQNNDGTGTTVTMTNGTYRLVSTSGGWAVE